MWARDQAATWQQQVDGQLKRATAAEGVLRPKLRLACRMSVPISSSCCRSSSVSPLPPPPWLLLGAASSGSCVAPAARMGADPSAYEVTAVGAKANLCSARVRVGGTTVYMRPSTLPQLEQQT